MEGGLVAHTLHEQRDINDAKAIFDDVTTIKADPVNPGASRTSRSASGSGYAASAGRSAMSFIVPGIVLLLGDAAGIGLPGLRSGAAE